MYRRINILADFCLNRISLNKHIKFRLNWIFFHDDANHELTNQIMYILSCKSDRLNRLFIKRETLLSKKKKHGNDFSTFFSLYLLFFCIYKVTSRILTSDVTVFWNLEIFNPEIKSIKQTLDHVNWFKRAMQISRSIYCTKLSEEFIFIQSNQTVWIESKHYVHWWQNVLSMS